MENSVILKSPALIVMLLVALITVLCAQFIKKKWLCTTVHIFSFLVVMASITYALLLGALLDEILIVVLIFALISLFSFIPREMNESKKNDVQDKCVPEEENNPITRKIHDKNMGRTENTEETK